MKKRFYRHGVAIRVTHWVSVLALLVLTMSGMQIFNAHPALYASDASNFDRPVFAMRAAMDDDGRPYGYVQIGSHRIKTTGLLGWTADGVGGEAPRGFPAWATIPAYRDLADGRRWHILFAWIFGLCALIYAPFAFRLWPKLKEWRALPQAIMMHLVPWRVRAHACYNPLQKASYFGLVFVLAPLAIVSGLALAPSVDAWAPWLPALLGGRQFARIWHFVAMFGLIGFFAIHVVMVALTGLWNNLRSMITGWFATEKSLR